MFSFTLHAKVPAGVQLALTELANQLATAAPNSLAEVVRQRLGEVEALVNSVYR